MKIDTKMGITRNGKIIVPYQYDSIEPMRVDGEESSVLFKARNGSNVTIISLDTEDDTSGYAYKGGFSDIVRDYENDVAIVKQRNTLHILIDTKLNILTEYSYIEIKPMNNGYYLAKGRNGFDIYDPQGKLMYEGATPATVDSEESKTLFITSNSDDLFGLIKFERDDISEVDMDFTSIGEFKKGVSVVTMQNELRLRYGLLDIKFNELLEPIYDNIFMLNLDLYAVCSKGKYGVYSVSKEKYIIHIEFS